MSLVVVERRLDPPARVEDVRAMKEQADWCMKQYRVRHLTSLLALDGVGLLCAFEAPDAEAVRGMMRTLAARPDRVWAGSLHATADSPALAEHPTVAVVERTFDEPVAFDDIQAREERGRWCLEHHRARFLCTYFSTDRRRMVCLYAAPDAEAARRAQEQAAMPFDRVWPAHVHNSP